MTKKNTMDAGFPESEVLEGDYRGHRMLIMRLTPQDRFPFQIGVRKARLIVKHFEAIKAFAEKSILIEDGPS